MPLQYVLKTGKQPKNRRVARALEKKEPKIIENPKQAIFMKGGKTSEIVKSAISDLYLLKKPFASKLGKRNDFQPFEDAKNIEFLTQKNDASLFVFGSHNKKRPHNLVIGRTFDFQVLDMVEFGVENYKPMNASGNKLNQAGSKPLMIFQGDHFVNNESMKIIQNLLLDFFRGEEPKEVNLGGLDHVIVVTAVSESKLLFRHYALSYKKSGTRTPYAELELVGPSMDLAVRRTKLAPKELRKQANWIPQELRKSKTANKNLSKNALGEKLGRIHVKQQDINEIALSRAKALRSTEVFEDNDANVEALRAEKRKADHMAKSFEDTEQNLRTKRTRVDKA